jgi:hypothetical protein
MSYLLEPYDQNSFAIVNENAAFSIGFVDRREGRYRVQCVVADDIVEVAMVNSLDEAIPSFAAFYESHPPRWEPTDDAGCVIAGPAAQRHRATRYTKWTDYAWLDVRQQKPGQWVAFRDDYPLMRDGQPAIFATREEAQRVADLHERQGYPRSEPINDGCTWPVDPGFAEYMVSRGRWPITVNGGPAIAA